MVTAKAAKKSIAVNHKRPAPARTKKPNMPKSKAKARNTLVPLLLVPPEVAQLDAEVARRQAAEPRGTVTRASVLHHLVRGLPAVPAKSSRRAPGAGEDAHGKYEDITIGSVVQRFRFIEPGKFTMGSPPSEAGRWDDEGPQHEVTLTNAYQLADTQVTQALWEAVMGANPARFKGADRPVETVSLDDAKLFLSKLNALAPGLDARLPTEAEWENACRAGTTTDRYGELDTVAVYYGNSPEGTQPVRTKAPNPFGLYDMLGNVYEWCEDWWGRYEGGPVIDPRGPSTGSGRVFRGGSWLSFAGLVRAAHRLARAPGSRLGILGLRLARGHQV